MRAFGLHLSPNSAEGDGAEVGGVAAVTVRHRTVLIERLSKLHRRCRQNPDGVVEDDRCVRHIVALMLFHLQNPRMTSQMFKLHTLEIKNSPR